MDYKLVLGKNVHLHRWECASKNVRVLKYFLPPPWTQYSSFSLNSVMWLRTSLVALETSISLEGGKWREGCCRPVQPAWGTWGPAPKTNAEATATSAGCARSDVSSSAQTCLWGMLRTEDFGASNLTLWMTRLLISNSCGVERYRTEKMALCGRYSFVLIAFAAF